jgi:hypothetical protein
VLVYATSSDLTNASVTLPADADVDDWLTAASGLVSEATLTDVYTVDGTGLPTDTTKAAAMRDAVIAQVKHWVKLGVDPIAGPAGTGGVVTSTALLSGNVQYATYAKQAEDRAAATVALSASAVAQLRAAGLGMSQPGSY